MKKYGTDSKLDELVDSDNWEDRVSAAEQGYGLDKLINDEYWNVRAAVAEQGYGLDKLVNDKDSDVRAAVAEQGYGLDKLINDEYWNVRAAVARQGYRLDKLIKDKEDEVRIAVVEQGYGLDKLICCGSIEDEVYKYLKEHNYKTIFDWAKDNNVNLDVDEWIHSKNKRKRKQAVIAGYGLDNLVDEDCEIRRAAAKQGYRLDLLITDLYSRSEVLNYLREHNYKTVFDWAKDNNVDIDIEEWLHSENWTKRYEVARAGYHLDVLIHDKNEDVRTYVSLQHMDLDSLIHSEDEDVRCEVARHGYGLDILINDDDYHVRCAVAEQGYGLDKLVHDDDYHVRCAVAKQGYGFDILVNDDDSWVRQILVSNGYRLDILICDKYDTDYDDDDDDYDHYECVHDAVLDYLREHNYKTIFDWAKDNNIEIDIDDWLYATDRFQRDQLAMAGYGLDILIYDEDWDVRRSVSRYLEEHNYKTIFDWAKDNNIDIDINEWSQSENWAQRYEVAKAGYHLDVLIHDKDKDVRDAVNKYLKNNNLTMKKWMEQNGSNASTALETIQYLESFIHKVEDSSKIKVETSYDSVEEFFEDTSNESYEDKESITIVTVETKIPLIKLEKTKLNDKNVFKFIATISIETEDISIKSIFETKEKFNQLVQSTITNLREYSQFAIYADELENCL